MKTNYGIHATSQPSSSWATFANHSFGTLIFTGTYDFNFRNPVRPTATPYGISHLPSGNIIVAKPSLSSSFSFSSSIALFIGGGFSGSFVSRTRQPSCARPLAEWCSAYEAAAHRLLFPPRHTSGITFLAVKCFPVHIPYSAVPSRMVLRAIPNNVKPLRVVFVVRLAIVTFTYTTRLPL